MDTIIEIICAECSTTIDPNLLLDDTDETGVASARVDDECENCGANIEVVIKVHR